MVVDIGDPITLRSDVMDDDIIDLRVDDDTLPLDDNDLQEENGVDGNVEEEDEFDDQKITSEEEDDELEEEDDVYE
ncbi:uncharacterized protein DS421_16g552890 [Arachis hypogaea]|nr:uncharacterized protein DS421_16g552890 [Arachis hypogaea]